MLATINKRIQELVAAGAEKEMVKQGMNEEEIKKELYVAAVCTLIGA